MKPFVYATAASRVVFGAGTLAGLPAEVQRLGGGRVLLIHGPGLATAADLAAAALGRRLAARFDGVAMHTPVEVTETALDIARLDNVDTLVTIGGGSATGLGKALALRTGLPLIAAPSTYAGSEVTPVIGETVGGVKATGTSPLVQPKTVIYDVELTIGMPVRLSVASGFNAVAHAVEALYSHQANPVIDEMAADAIKRFASALPRIASEPTDLDARADALIGAWLAGTCLGAVGMGLHHKLCHTLGGSFGMPHAETHAVILPQAMAYNAAAAPEAMARIAQALGVRDAPSGMYDLIGSLGGPTSLADLGFDEHDVERAAEMATSRPYPNPREVTAEAVIDLLRDAQHGRRPNKGGLPDSSRLTDDVVTSFAAAPNPRARQLVTDLVRRLHEYVCDNEVTEEEWAYGIDFLTRTGAICDDKRQEFVLLSDTLGVSSMVDLLTNSRTPRTTPSAVLGPFYVAGPPAQPAGADISGGLSGTPLWTDVTIADPAGGPVAGAVVDVWQSNNDGFYDVQLPDQDGPVLRARFTSDEAGRIRFWSILPSEYPIPDDGPVGQMLAATGRHPYRAPHLHFMISAPGFRRLVTQLFVAGGAYLDSDTVFGVKEPLIVDFERGTGEAPPGRKVEGEWRRLAYEFRIAPQA